MECLLEISASSLDNKFTVGGRMQTPRWGSWTRCGQMVSSWDTDPEVLSASERGGEGEGADQDGHCENMKCTQKELPRMVDSRTNGRA